VCITRTNSPATNVGMNEYKKHLKLWPPKRTATLTTEWAILWYIVKSTSRRPVVGCADGGGRKGRLLVVLICGGTSLYIQTGKHCLDVETNRFESLVELWHYWEWVKTVTVVSSWLNPSFNRIQTKQSQHDEEWEKGEKKEHESEPFYCSNARPRRRTDL
jgi:hypothetical protein